jgi:hypothetical protein
MPPKRDSNLAPNPWRKAASRARAALGRSTGRSRNSHVSHVSHASSPAASRAPKRLREQRVERRPDDLCDDALPERLDLDRLVLQVRPVTPIDLLDPSSALRAYDLVVRDEAFAIDEKAIVLVVEHDL